MMVWDRDSRSTMHNAWVNRTLLHSNLHYMDLVSGLSDRFLKFLFSIVSIWNLPSSIIWILELYRHEDIHAIVVLPCQSVSHQVTVQYSSFACIIATHIATHCGLYYCFGPYYYYYCNVIIYWNIKSSWFYIFAKMVHVVSLESIQKDIKTSLKYPKQYVKF